MEGHCLQGREGLSRGLGLGSLLCVGESWYVLVCVEWIGVSVCMSVHLTCLGGYFLCMLGSFSTASIGACMGIAVCLVSVRSFLLMLDHVYYILRKLWLYFQTHHQMINQSKTSYKTVLQIFASLCKSIASFIQLLKR